MRKGHLNDFNLLHDTNNKVPTAYIDLFEDDEIQNATEHELA